MREQRMRHSSFVLGDNLYVVGGFKCYSLTWEVKSMECFNVARFLKEGRSQWVKIADPASFNVTDGLVS